MYDDDVNDKEEEEAVIGMWSAIIWLIIMTLLVALLSEYLVSTIQVCHVYMLTSLISWINMFDILKN